MNSVLSFLVGAFIALLPTFIFAKIFFKRTGAKAVKQIVRSFYLGEMLKFILTILLFGMVFYFGKPKALWLFLGFILAQCISYFALFNIRAALNSNKAGR